MSRIYKLFVSGLLIAFLSGCGKKDTSLLDQVPVQPRINPELKYLLKDANLLSVQLDSTGIISGFTTNAAFHSPDFFKGYEMTTLGTVNYYGQGLFANNVNGPLCRVNRNYFVYISADPYQKINCSTDYGASWSSFHLRFDGGVPYYFTGNTSMSDVLFLNNSSILLLLNQYRYISSNESANSTFLCKVNPSTHSVSLLSSIEGLSAKSIHFINDKVGWLLLNEGTKVAKTTDGGVTWSKPVAVASNGNYNLTVGSEKNLFLYNAGDIQGYFSHDGGINWTSTNTNFRYNHVAFGGASVLYALDGARLLKSEDAGMSWKSIQEYTNDFNGVNRLFFLSDKQGLAYGAPSKKLYITTDGGQNWKLLMASFGYIYE